MLMTQQGQRIGVFVCECGRNIAGSVDCEAVRAYAEKLPDVVKLWFRYTYTHLSQSNWESDSELWDWEREKLWLPGYKNILTGQATFGLLRLGIPFLLYVKYRNMTWLPGKNARAANVLTAGLQVPVPIW